MPRAKEPKIDKDAIYQCWMSGTALVDGEEFTFQQGQRLPGDHRLVQATAQFWVLDGEPLGSEWDVLVERNEAARTPPDFELTLAGALPTPLALEDAIRLTRAVRVRGGYASDQEVVTFEKDTLFSARSEIASVLPPDAYEHEKARRR